MKRLSILCALILLPAGLSADFVTLSDEALLATAPDNEYALHSLDSAPRGAEFMVSWTQSFARYGSSTLTDWGAGVSGRRVDADGHPVGFQLTLVPVADKIDIATSALAADAAGRYAVVWDSSPDGHAHTSLRLRQFSPAGATVSNAQVDQVERGGFASAVAMGPAGRPVVAWERQLSQGTPPSALFAQPFLPTGRPAAPRLQVTGRRVSLDQPPVIGSDGLGNGVMVYRAAQPNGDSILFLRLFDRAGQPRGNEIRLSASVRQAGPALSVRADGRFVVAWFDNGRIKARIYAPPARPVGPEIEVNAGRTPVAGFPDVALAGDGRFAVAWEEQDLANNQPQYWIRGFDTQGAPLAEALRADQDRALYNSYDPFFRPTLAVSRKGTFLVAWASWPQGIDRARIFARLFGDPDATAP
jgi:hypothetical protein